jgi:ATPase subunit of ABC transporter with duplicated ATPase domains
MAARKKAKARRKTKSRVKRRKAPARKPAVRRRKAAKPRKKASRKTTARRAPARKPVRAAPRKPRPAARPVRMEPRETVPGERIGIVTHYFSHLAVAVIRLDAGVTLRVGDRIHIQGHTTDFGQRVDSLQVEHQSVMEVGPADDFGIKVIDHAREHDVVYRVS